MARQPRRTLKQRLEQVENLHAYDLNIDSREVFVESYFDAYQEEETGVDWRMASGFIKNLAFLDGLSSKPILVHLISCGGDWNYGIAMYDIIKACRSSVVTLSHAHARSMSSVIPQAATRRIIMPNADFLFHFGTMECGGDCISTIAEADKAKELNTRMVDIYAARCSRGPFFRRNRYTRDRVRAWLIEQMNTKREVYLRPCEAVDFGFVDGIFGQAGFRTMDDLRRGI